MNEFTNYGDVNFMDYGGTFVSQNPDGCYQVIVLKNMSQHDSAYDDAERKYYLAESYVDFDDDWMDLEEVQSCYEISIDRLSDEFDEEELAYACVGYYGAEEFGGCPFIEESLKTREEAVEILKGYGILQ